MKKPTRRTWIGYAAVAGGVLGLALAPIMVTIKYMTGWAVVPQPFWVDGVSQTLGSLLGFADPPQLWTAYGSLYTAALALMILGFAVVAGQFRDDTGRLRSKGFVLVLIGLLMTIAGDAVHSWTWHQNGLTVPTPGTNPVANTAYAVHMMGMNFVMAGTMWVGISALRRKYMARWLAIGFVGIFPSAVLASVTLLPTTPSGALWLFCVLMTACGHLLARGSFEQRAVLRPSA